MEKRISILSSIDIMSIAQIEALEEVLRDLRSTHEYVCYLVDSKHRMRDLLTQDDYKACVHSQSYFGGDIGVFLCFGSLTQLSKLNKALTPYIKIAVDGTITSSEEN